MWGVGRGYRVIVKNTARGAGAVSFSPLPLFFLDVWAGSWEEKRSPYCTCSLYRHPPTPHPQHRLTHSGTDCQPQEKLGIVCSGENYPHRARKSRSAVPPPSVGFGRSRFECNDEMRRVSVHRALAHCWSLQGLVAKELYPLLV